MSVILPSIPLLIGYGLIGGMSSLSAMAAEEGRAMSSGGAAIFSLATLIAFGLIIASMIIRLVFNASTGVIANKQVRGQSVSMSDLFRPGPTVWPTVGFGIVATILFVVGALVFYVPALLVIAFVWPAIALVADGVSIGEAISRSVQTLKRDWLGAILFALAWNLLIVASAIPCGLGLLATIPMGHILMALVFRDAIGNSGTSGY